MKVTGGIASLEVEVRSVVFDVRIQGQDRMWRATVENPDRTDKRSAPPQRTWAAAYRQALRLADQMAPFRSKKHRGVAA